MIASNLSTMCIIAKKHLRCIVFLLVFGFTVVGTVDIQQGETMSSAPRVHPHSSIDPHSAKESDKLENRILKDNPSKVTPDSYPRSSAECNSTSGKRLQVDFSTSVVENGNL